MTATIDFATIIQGTFVLLCGGIIWFLKNIHGDFKEATKKIGDHEIRLALAEEKIRQLENRQ